MRVLRVSNGVIGAAALWSACVGVAVLVGHGVFHRLDEHAVRHWMPWLSVGRGHLVSIRGLFLPLVVHGSLAGSLVDLWTYPASLFVSAVVVLVCARLLRGRAAVLLLALYLAANAVELAGKIVVERPALYTARGMHIASFDHSLPSGHALRAFVVATALAWTWRRGRLAFVWAATIPFALVALGAHAPLDVVTAVLVFAALYVTVTATRWTALFM